MGLRCRWFGHQWGKGLYHQYCQRCLAYRTKVLDKHKQMVGDKCVEWRVFEPPNFKKMMKNNKK